VNEATFKMLFLSSDEMHQLPEGAQRQCRPRLHCGGEVLQRLLADPNVLVAISKGMQAVKLCTNKILQFLTGGAG